MVNKEQIIVGGGCVRSFMGYEDPEPLEEKLKELWVKGDLQRGIPHAPTQFPEFNHVGCWGDRRVNTALYILHNRIVSHANFDLCRGLLVL